MPVHPHNACPFSDSMTFPECLICLVNSHSFKQDRFKLVTIFHTPETIIQCMFGDPYFSCPFGQGMRFPECFVSRGFFNL